MGLKSLLRIAKFLSSCCGRVGFTSKASRPISAWSALSALVFGCACSSMEATSGQAARAYFPQPGYEQSVLVVAMSTADGAWKSVFASADPAVIGKCADGFRNSIRKVNKSGLPAARVSPPDVLYFHTKNRRDDYSRRFRIGAVEETLGSATEPCVRALLGSPRVDAAKYSDWAWADGERSSSPDPTKWK